MLSAGIFETASSRLRLYFGGSRDGRPPAQAFRAGQAAGSGQDLLADQLFEALVFEELKLSMRGWRLCSGRTRHCNARFYRIIQAHHHMISGTTLFATPLLQADNPAFKRFPAHAYPKTT